MRDNSLIKRIIIHVFSVKVGSLAAWKMCKYERAYVSLYFERHSLKKHINFLKLSMNEHLIIFQDFSKTLDIYFPRTFPGLGISIFKFQHFSRFSMTVRTLQLSNTTTFFHQSRLAHNRPTTDGSFKPSCHTKAKKEYQIKISGASRRATATCTCKPNCCIYKQKLNI